MSDAILPFRPHVTSVEDLHGPAGRLEAVLNSGQEDALYAAVVAHPHPPSGGTMHNKVVYHAAKAFSSFGLPVLRFNFRGAGLSEGTHDEGRGEVDDVRAALDWITAKYALPILVAGFSFGSNVGLRACCGDPRVRGLVGLGLPVRAAGRDYTYNFLPGCGPVPKLFVSGDHDAFSPRGVLESVLVSAAEPKRIVWVDGADHFFAGTAQSPASKLGVMSDAIRAWLADEFGL
ncbi:MAG: alpha/beta hydrolase [Acidobacteria bacterium]|nr:alpha/beta hydrolase [Acidobacteriota bacterium]